MTCSECGARHMFGFLRHRDGCPMGLPNRPDVSSARSRDALLFTHPDARDLDANVGYWYPQLLAP